MRKSCVFIGYFIGPMVKVVLYLHFLYTKDNRLRQIKKNMNDEKIAFLTSDFSYCLNLKHVFFWHKVISCFKYKVYSFFFSTLAIK